LWYDEHANGASIGQQVLWDREWAMRRIVKKILQILDGTPAVYANQRRWHGQSVVELALVTPLLIVLLMGLAEIGWFANNYLILLEVTRVGARLGTTQTGETSPMVWNNNASRSPDTGWQDYPDEINGTPVDSYRSCIDVRNPNNRELRGFYNYIACVMIQQMDPLVFRNFTDDNALQPSVPDNPDADPPYIRNTDDIVISAFAFQAIDPAKIKDGTQAFHNNSGPTPYSLLQRIPGLNDLPQVVVVGRYPSNANECTVDVDGTTPREWERDPFDYFKDGRRNYQLKNPSLGDPSDESNRNYVELEGYDAPSYAPYVNPVDPQPAPKPERQVGWSLTGNHVISRTVNPLTGVAACIGSEWTIAEIEELMNVPDFSLSLDQAKKDERERLPSQGLVLVELFWRHELLLKNPVFNPVWTILGDRTTVSVWAAFPLPTTEPRINIKYTS
jgi:hypothetical protein